MIDPEARLPPEVQVANDLDSVRQLKGSGVFVAAVVTASARGEGPGDFKAVAVAVTLVARDRHASGQIDVDGNGSHDCPPAVLEAQNGCPDQAGIPTVNLARRSSGKAEKVRGLHLKTEEPF